MKFYDHEPEPSFDDTDEDDRSITCRRCGQEDLHWRSVTSPDGMSERSVLFDATMHRHVCMPSADDFEEIA